MRGPSRATIAKREARRSAETQIQKREGWVVWGRNLAASGLLLLAGGGITYTTAELTDSSSCQVAQSVILDETWNAAVPEDARRAIVAAAAERLRTCINE
jgi:hypothetical protein